MVLMLTPIWAQTPFSDDDGALIANLDFYRDMVVAKDADFLSDYEMIEHTKMGKEQKSDEVTEDELPDSDNHTP